MGCTDSFRHFSRLETLQHARPLYKKSDNDGIFTSLRGGSASVTQMAASNHAGDSGR
jgi:hypothetical protein